MKRAAIKDILRSYMSDVALIQETKLSSVSGNIIKDIWGHSYIDNWVYCDPIGALGGILLMWNRSSFCKKEQWVGEFSVFVLLEEVSSISIWIVTSV